MKNHLLIKKLEGVQTIKSIMALLNVNRQKAIYTVYRLRKEGYVKSKRLKEGNRAYYISFENKLKGTSYYDLINSISPVKISEPAIYRIYGKEISYEEALIFAIKTGSLRTILASLALFRRINDWTKLYHLAKTNHIERQVGALYDLARKIIRTRRMAKQFRKNALPQKNCTYEFMVSDIKSEDYNSIDKNRQTEEKKISNMRKKR